MDVFDVIIIGAGVVGSAVARECSRWRLKTAVLEKEPDVACGNSSRNTGMLHAGFTYKTGSLKAECAVEGNQEFDQVARELGVPFKRTGKLVVGFTEHDKTNILKYKAIGEANGVKGMRMIEKDEISRIDANAGGEFAMYVPSSGILDPMQYTIALAENACMNGVRFFFGEEVTAITKTGSADDGTLRYHISTKAGPGRVTKVSRVSGIKTSPGCMAGTEATDKDITMVLDEHSTMTQDKGSVMVQDEGAAGDPCTGTCGGRGGADCAIAPDKGAIGDPCTGTFGGGDGAEDSVMVPDEGAAGDLCTDKYTDADSAAHRHCFTTRWVINCAGMYASRISEMLGYPNYPTKGFKGEYYVLDKNAGKYLSVPVYPAPNDKGGFSTHATPTVDGNVLVGPDSYLTDEPEDYKVTKAHMDGLFEDGSRMFRQMRREFFIRNFAGIRWKRYDPDTGEILDFLLESDDEHPQTVNLVGIESPGVTCALPLARRAVKLLTDRECPEPYPDFNPVRPVRKRFYEMTREERAEAVRRDPLYGEIICRCENVTRAEILSAIHNPLGVHTVTGIKNRTRATMGRCQGGYCETRITRMIEKELGLRPEEVRFGRADSWMFTGKVRDER